MVTSFNENVVENLSCILITTRFNRFVKDIYVKTRLSLSLHVQNEIFLGVTISKEHGLQPGYSFLGVYYVDSGLIYIVRCELSVHHRNIFSSISIPSIVDSEWSKERIGIKMCVFCFVFDLTPPLDSFPLRTISLFFCSYVLNSDLHYFYLVLVKFFIKKILRA